MKIQTAFFIMILTALSVIFLMNLDRIAFKGSVVISQEYIDSLYAVANMPPDTVKIDTTIYELKEVIKEVEKIVYVKDSAGIRTFRDSIVNNDISVWAEALIKGDLLSFSWRYIPKRQFITYTVEIPRPYLITTTKYDKEKYRSIIAMGNIGRYDNETPIGFDLLYKTKGSDYYGYGYRNINGLSFHELKVGMQIIKF